MENIDIISFIKFSNIHPSINKANKDNKMVDWINMGAIVNVLAMCSA
jgi:hypothetical protein